MIPFSNGSEYRTWLDKNCRECLNNYDYTECGNQGHNPDCFAEEKLAMACVSDGQIGESTYKFIGLDKGQDCPHREEK